MSVNIIALHLIVADSFIHSSHRWETCGGAKRIVLSLGAINVCTKYDDN